MLETIINKIRRLTTEIVKDELHDDIREQELNSCTNAEYKLIQVRNYIESYIQTKLTVPKNSSLSLLPSNITTRVKSTQRTGLAPLYDKTHDSQFTNSEK